MSTLEAIVIGIVQGLSEFLPISSTAHMTLAGRAFDLIKDPVTWTAFIAVVQLGTLAAVLVYFWKDLVKIASSFIVENLRLKPFKEQSHDSKMGWSMIIGTIPIAIVGLLLRDLIEGAITKNLIVIGSSLVVLGVVLEIAERSGKFNRKISETTILDALWVGIAQVFALIPGSSRSGTTITGGMFLGLTREAAARFSFLLSVPAIGASGLLELEPALQNLEQSGVVALVVSTLVAAVSGYFCIHFLLSYLRKRSTRLFVIYRIAIGSAILIAIWLGALQP